MNSSLTPRGMESRTWNGVDIQRRPSDGYVNATAMCRAAGKRWTHYLENIRTKEYLRALAAQTGCGAAVAGIPATGKAERDGWRLVGRGKLSAGRCGTYPPGCASWLFQKL